MQLTPALQSPFSFHLGYGFAHEKIKICKSFTGKGEYLASPEVLAQGVLHNLEITCMDPDGYSTTRHLKFILQPPIRRKSPWQQSSTGALLDTFIV